MLGLCDGILAIDGLVHNYDIHHARLVKVQRVCFTPVAFSKFMNALELVPLAVEPLPAVADVAASSTGPPLVVAAKTLP